MHKSGGRKQQQRSQSVRSQRMQMHAHTAWHAELPHAGPTARPTVPPAQRHRHRLRPACVASPMASRPISSSSSDHLDGWPDEEHEEQARAATVTIIDLTQSSSSESSQPQHHQLHWPLQQHAASISAQQEGHLRAPLVLPSPHTQRQRHPQPNHRHRPPEPIQQQHQQHESLQQQQHQHESLQQQQQLRVPTHITPLPKHVAVIMDGNARWAQQQGQPVSFGHEAGVRAFRALVANCAARGIKALTAFAFSRENFLRPAAEVDFFMRLFERTLAEQVDELHAQGVRLVFVGERQRLPASLVDRMERAERMTERNEGMLLSIAVAYGASHDLATAARRIAALAASGELHPDQVDERVLAEHLSTAVATQHVGPVDLLVRTSGEQRVSNFMLLEAAYAEIVFSDVFWPAFGERDLDEALEAFAARKRRFGRRP